MFKFSLTALLAVAALNGQAAAQSRNSFQVIDGVNDLEVENSGRTYTVYVGPSPTVTVGGVDYPINSVFGFWCLSDDNNYTQCDGSDVGDWTFHRNSASTGDIGGWKTNPNLGLDPGESMAFTFSQFKESDRDGFGFHVRVDGTLPGGGNTFYITGPSFQPPCIADYNQDGGIDGADVETFFADWEAGSPGADVNGDGGVDGADVQAFFDPWKAGGCV